MLHVGNCCAKSCGEACSFCGKSCCKGCMCAGKNCGEAMKYGCQNCNCCPDYAALPFTACSIIFALIYIIPGVVWIVMACLSWIGDEPCSISAQEVLLIIQCKSLTSSCLLFHQCSLLDLRRKGHRREV